MVLAVGRRAAILLLSAAATSTAGAAHGGTWVGRHDKGCSTTKDVYVCVVLFLEVSFLHSNGAEIGSLGVWCGGCSTFVK